MNNQRVAPLLDLGFTEIEALVYLCLLQCSPLTGYAIAKAIGKPTANTYKAIERLAHKDAIVVDEGENRLCRAVPPELVLQRIKTDFDQHSRDARELMVSLHRHPDDERIYQMRSGNQVLDRARDMLAKAGEVVVADLFPAAARALQDDLIDAAERGIEVCVLVYESIELGRARVVQYQNHEYTLRQWPGINLALVCDAQQHIYALMTEDCAGVHQAVWSESLYLSCMAHNHLATQFELAVRYRQTPESSVDIPIRLIRDQVSGFKRLRERFSG